MTLTSFKSKIIFITVSFLFLEVRTAPISWNYPGCASVTDTDFTYTTLVSNLQTETPLISEPTKMDFDMDASGNVDIYFVEIRPGNIKRYSGATKTLKTLVKLPNWGGGNSRYFSIESGVEEGVTGIVLDPNFKSNHFVYVHWSPLPDTLQVFRISRFTVAGDTILLSSQKVLLEIPGQRQTCCHTGGGMAFDAYGDLWISMGANSGRKGDNVSSPPEGINENTKFQSEEWGAASTYGLRGGILRIHPDNSPRGYSIPADNFGEYFAKKTGNSQYNDTSKVSPEIFIKGCRNPYSLTLDPVRRWVTWGDVGPDALPGELREEDNLRKAPGFEGWPYFVGQNTRFSGNKVDTLPLNDSKWNMGLKTLPPARKAFHQHSLGSAPITGPIYRYDGDLNSPLKLPPHFNRKWFVTDWTRSIITVLTLNVSGDSVLSEEPIFRNHEFSGPLDFKQGPDGALYVLNYGSSYFSTTNETKIERISYKGSCRPVDLKLEKPTTGIEPKINLNSRKGYIAHIEKNMLLTIPKNAIGIQVFNLSGKIIWQSEILQPGVTLELPVNLPTGALQYRWITHN